MTPLADLITRQIRAEGPISIAQYMQTCLLHPEFGYYTTRDPLGAAGDFTTAPEISQMFGEVVGLCLVQVWLDQGAPSPFTLAELGPGRGTLMADILRATRQVPGFHAGARIVLVEASPTLRALQAKALHDHTPTWVDGADDLPHAPLFLVANEFFDALPIRQFQRSDGDLWSERMIGLKDDELCFGQATPAPLGALAHRLGDTRPGDLVETCAPAQAIALTLGARIAQSGGAALIIDYGDWRSLGDTLQALHRHQPVPPLDHPGDSDLTAHVDFEALCQAAGTAHSRLTPQGIFLERLGITTRAQTLAKQLTGPKLENHISAHRRLTHPAEMGSLFKVCALYPEGAAAPPGLTT